MYSGFDSIGSRKVAMEEGCGSCDIVPDSLLIVDISVWGIQMRGNSVIVLGANWTVVMTEQEG